MSKCTESPEKTLAPSDKDLDADVEGESDDDHPWGLTVTKTRLG